MACILTIQSRETAFHRFCKYSLLIINQMPYI